MIDHSMIQSCKFPDGALAGSAVAGVSAVAVGAALLFVSFMFELSFCQFFRCLAEGEGFEPPEARASTVFKTAAFDHSATPPVWG